MAASHVLQEPEGQLGDLRLLVTLASDKDSQVLGNLACSSTLDSGPLLHHEIGNTKVLAICVLKNYRIF